MMCAALKYMVAESEVLRPFNAEKKSEDERLASCVGFAKAAMQSGLVNREIGIFLIDKDQPDPATIRLWIKTFSTKFPDFDFEKEFRVEVVLE